MATDVYVCICSTNDWNGTNAWGGEADETARNSHYDGANGTQYVDMATAESNRQRDLTLATGDDERENWEIFGEDWDGNPDTNNITFDGWTCDYSNDNYIRVYPKLSTDEPDYSSGIDTAAYILQDVTSGQTMGIDNDHSAGAYISIEFTKIQIRHITTSGYNLYTKDSNSRSENIKFDKCYLKQDTANSNCHFVGIDLTDEWLMVGCVFEGGTHGFKGGLTGGNGLRTVNCTIGNVTDDAVEWDGRNNRLTNCALLNNGDDWQDTASGADPLTCAADEGAGSYSSIDLTPTEPADRAGDLNDIFTDYSNGDFSLTGSTDIADIIDAGTPVNTESRVPEDDIMGNARPQGSNTPGVGAYYPAASGPTEQDVAGSLPAMSGALTRKVTYHRGVSGAI